MSAKQYRFFGQVQEVNDNGETIDAGWSCLAKWVQYSDYARLKAEVEQLTERNKFLEQIDSYLQGANEHSFEQRCDELEAEVERLRKARDWQPIETAPRDGTDVLCISGEYMFVAWIDSRGYWNSGDDSRFVPDYWMHLPRPPAAKEGKPSV